MMGMMLGIPSFQDKNHLAVGQSHQLLGHIAVAGGAQLVAAQRRRVTVGRVEAGGHHDQIGVELPGDRHDYGPEGGQVLGVSHWRIERTTPTNINVEALAVVDARLLEVPGAREEVTVVVPVQRYIKHVRVVVEDLLEAIAVMHIPVDDQNSFHFEFLLQLFDRNGYRVEETESHRLLVLGVTARRSHHREAVLPTDTVAINKLATRPNRAILPYTRQWLL